MSEINTGASIRISTWESDLNFVSEALAIVPSRQHRIGDNRSPRNPQSGKYEESIWIYESPLPDNTELREHIDLVLSLLEARRVKMDAIHHRLSGIDIFCKFSSENGQGSVELGVNILKRLADQGVDLIIDLYPSA